MCLLLFHTTAQTQLSTSQNTAEQQEQRLLPKVFPIQQSTPETLKDTSTLQDLFSCAPLSVQAVHLNHYRPEGTKESQSAAELQNSLTATPPAAAVAADFTNQQSSNETSTKNNVGPINPCNCLNIHMLHTWEQPPYDRKERPPLQSYGINQAVA